MSASSQGSSNPAPKPVLLTIDDDPQVLRSVERDLRRHYSSTYRVLAVGSGREGIEVLNKLKLRKDPVALLLADQRMPNMDGVSFLEQASAIYPDAKRTLLTAYADTEAAIQAINKVRLDHYLMKPWDPPEQQLYPPLDDLLDEWQATYRRPKEDRIRVIGHQWSAKSHELKDFLARNRIPFQWIDVETKDKNTEVRTFLEALGEIKEFPVVVLQDGTKLETPTPEQVAERAGMRMHAETSLYDLVIAGGGPAGLAAAVYGASEGLKTLLVDRAGPGGQAGMSSRIENYLGFPAGVSGGELTHRAVTQAKRLGAEIISPQEIVSIRAEGNLRILKLKDDSEITSYAVIVATGLEWRRLDVEGIERLTGAGVYYGAAMTEALSCKDQDVFVIGGANSAGQAAMFFSRYANSVTMLVRAKDLDQSMSRYLIDQINETPNVKVLFGTQLVEAKGDRNLEQIVYRNNETGETQTVNAAALFVFIGAMPCTSWLKGVISLDEKGFILAGPDLLTDGKRPAGWSEDRDPYFLETALPGVFVAGDTRAGSMKRVASSVGEGAQAVALVHQYLAHAR